MRPRSLISDFFFIFALWKDVTCMHNFNILASQDSFADWIECYLITNPEDIACRDDPCMKMVFIQHAYVSATGLPAKSESGVMFCLQLLSKILP